MCAQLIMDGKKIAQEIEIKLKERFQNINAKLATILIGRDEASKIYLRQKKLACERVGVDYVQYVLSENVRQSEVIRLIRNVQSDGILVQLPLPKHFSLDTIITAIDPSKDVDCFHPLNLGKLFLGYEKLAPCTPKGILKMLDYYKIKVEGENVLIINHSIVVGKPLAVMLLNRNATVSICHKYTKDLTKYTKEADIIITATGVPNLIKKDMIKDGCVIVDAGIARVNGKVVGDVNFDDVKDKVYAISPVPGGVGPLTVAMVLDNLWELICNVSRRDDFKSKEEI